MVAKSPPKKSPVLVLRLSAHSGDLDFSLFVFNPISPAGAQGQGWSPPGEDEGGTTASHAQQRVRDGAWGKHHSLVPLLERGEKSQVVFAVLVE